MSGKIRRALPALTWLDGALPGHMLIYVCGVDRVMVENHLCVLEFTPHRVRLAGAGGCLTIEGDALSLCEARRGALIVRGRLRAILLPESEAGAP